MDERDNLYWLESYVPAWIARDESYRYAFRERLVQMMEMRDYEVREICEPFVHETPDCPPPPGLVTIRVECIAREFDAVIDGDFEDEEPPAEPAA